MSTTRVARRRSRVSCPPDLQRATRDARIPAVVLAVASFSLIGCAYSVSGDLPAHLTRVRIGVVRNETTLRGAEADLTAELVDAVSRDPRLRVAGEDADCRLDVRLIEYRRQTLREDRLDDAVDAQVLLVAQVSFTDLTSGRKLLDRRRVSNRATDRNSGFYSLRRGEFERLGRRRAVADLARAIVRSVTEWWEE